MSDLALFRGRTFPTTLRCPVWIDSGESRCGEAVRATVHWSHDDDTDLVSVEPTCAAGHTLAREEDLDTLADAVREGAFASPSPPATAVQNDQPCGGR